MRPKTTAARRMPTTHQRAVLRSRSTMIVSGARRIVLPMGVITFGSSRLKSSMTLPSRCWAQMARREQWFRL
ncbi:hypothetical protein D3C71_1876750 [compost metagenome]